MKATTHPARNLVTAVLLVAIGSLITACAEESSPTAVESTSVLAAAGGQGKGGGKGGGGGGSGLTVTSAIPSKVPQGLTANIRVGGTAFEPGSVVEVLLNGKKTAKVVTNSTAFKDDTELIANITVANDATLASYDVRVTTPRRKKGIGIELLKVILGPQADLSVDESGGAVPGIYQDGLGSYVPNEVSISGANNLRVQPLCKQTGGRAFNVTLPDPVANPAWELSAPLAEPACGILQIAGLVGADCPDGIWCQIGDPPAPPNYSPSIFFFFTVDTDGREHGNGDDSYNIIWQTDGQFEVLQRRADGTPIQWRVTASKADLYLRPGDQDGQPQGQNTPVELDLTVILVE